MSFLWVVPRTRGRSTLGPDKTPQCEQTLPRFRGSGWQPVPRMDCERCVPGSDMDLRSPGEGAWIETCRRPGAVRGGQTGGAPFMLPCPADGGRRVRAGQAGDLSLNVILPRSRHLPVAVTEGSPTENLNKTGMRLWTETPRTDHPWGSVFANSVPASPLTPAWTPRRALVKKWRPFAGNPTAGKGSISMWFPQRSNIGAKEVATSP